MKRFFKKTLPATIALACCAAAAQASDAEGEFHGYFRAGVGSNSEGGKQACYGLEGVPKYRFGNECDIYGEFAYSKEIAKSANGTSFVATVMASIYAPNSDVGSDNHLDLAQMMVEAKNVPGLNGGIAWIGKRYYDRPDIHELDFKYLQGDGVGGGITGVQAGPGKFSYALFRNDVDQTVAATRHMIMYEGIPTNPGGELKIDSTIIRGDHKDNNTTSPLVANGWSLSFIHAQANKDVGIDNTLGLQFAKGSGIKTGGTDITATDDVKRTRLFDHLVYQFTPEFSTGFVALYQRDRANAGNKTWTSFGVHPVYALTDNFRLVGEIGHDNIKVNTGGSDQKLTKITLAPTLAMGKDYYSRPELRAFVTYAKWNDAARAAADLTSPGSTLSSTGIFGGKTNGTSIGLQVETWF
jgi:maltoporin